MSVERGLSATPGSEFRSAVRSAMREVLPHLVAGVKSMVRGHSPKEEADVLRVLDGGITPKDRERFRTERWQSHFPPAFVPQSFNPFLYNLNPLDPRSLSAALKEDERLKALPQEELDGEIQAAAQAKAERWGLRLTS